MKCILKFVIAMQNSLQVLNNHSLDKEISSYDTFQLCHKMSKECLVSEYFAVGFL